MIRWVMKIPTPRPSMVITGGQSLSESEKSVFLEEILEDQIPPVNVPLSHQALRW
jgi:hypothetical protein